MLTLKNGKFIDECGREVVFRGINFAADMKQPRNGVADYSNCPCTLAEADEHFTRIKALGFNCIRFLYTWDALQPDHPDLYNEAYINHAIALVSKAVHEYGFYVFMDPHQDIWSRFSGGSGAPLWTLHAAGFDPRYFHDTEAALLWDPKVKRQIKMQWASNYHRLVCLTMFTLFFSGEEYAPKALLNGVNVGTYLQNKYLAAVRHMMERFNEHDFNQKLIGWESLNEPGHGLIGYEHLDQFPNSHTHVKLGTAPTPFQAMLLGVGIPQHVGKFKFTGFGLRKIEDRFLVKPRRGTWLTAEDLQNLDEKYGWERSWKGGCIWALHGIYDPEARELLKPHYFRGAFGDAPIPSKLKLPFFEREEHASLLSGANPISGDAEQNSKLASIGSSRIFIEIYYVKHWLRFATEVKEVNSNWLHLMQAPVNMEPPDLLKYWSNDIDFTRLVYTPHFYDGLTLLLKRWRWLNVDAIGVMRNLYKSPLPALRFGDHQIIQCFADQFEYLKKEGRRCFGSQVPMLMSEIGIPYDMDKKSAYTSGYWDNQIRAMDANISALEKAKMSYTLWCYTIDNSHEFGDNFAGEDLSIYSKDNEVASHRGDPENGVRALPSVTRPSPVAAAGEIISTEFDLRRATYQLTVIPQKNGLGQIPSTLVFVPRFHFPRVRPLFNANVTEGSLEFDEAKSLLVWEHGATAGILQTLSLSGTPRFRDSAYSYVEGIHNVFKGLLQNLRRCIGYR